MFVPLPVPFVFQRTAPDLNAWRLKSPLALRSNSGKTFIFSFLSFPPFLLFSSPAPHPPCRSDSAMQTRPALLGRRCAEESSHTHTHTPIYTHARTHTLLRFLSEALTESFTLAGRLFKSQKRPRARWSVRTD